MSDIKDNEIREGVLRTPDERFENLPGYSFQPNYVEIAGASGSYRMHYLDEGDGNADPVLMLHGEPTWAYLYRKMVGPVADAGNRVIVPDLIGFGRSDKPMAISTHTYGFHVENISRFIQELDLNNITLVCQDWGSLIGLRVAAENKDRFARIVIANGGLPTGEQNMSEAFMKWRAQATRMQEAGDMPVGTIVTRDIGADIGTDIAAAYEAPFLDGSYKAGPLAMPLLVPVSPEDPAHQANVAAWQILQQWHKPFLTAFSDGDPITGGGDRVFQKLVPGAQGQKHTTIAGGGHFLQEDRGEEFAAVVARFIEDNPL